MPKTGNKEKPRSGFTLMEVMVATAVLSLGTLFVYEAFFMSLDTLNYCSDYLRVCSIADEKLWEAQDRLAHPGRQIDVRGKLSARNKEFDWNLAYGLIEDGQGLYKIDLFVSWQEGQRKARILRTAYAAYQKEQ
jgi:prepilin-type N-terminal cleavage/methylation domain-containing protein